MADVTALKERLRTQARDVVRIVTEDFHDEVKEQGPQRREGSSVGAPLRERVLREIAEFTSFIGFAEDDLVPTYLEEGTTPHVITPRSSGGTMVFFWDKAPPRLVKADGRVHLTIVHHPGSTVWKGWFTNIVNADRFLEKCKAALEVTG